MNFGRGGDVVGKEGTQTYKIQIGCNKTSSRKTTRSLETKSREENEYRCCWGAIFCLTQYKSTQKIRIFFSGNL